MTIRREWLEEHPWAGAAGVALVATEWLREPRWGWAAGAAILALLFLLLVWRSGWRQRVIAGTALLLSLTLLLGQRQVDRVSRDWAGERERRISEAFSRLSGELRTTLRQTDRLAAAALRVAGDDQTAAFDGLRKALPADGPEVAVVILESTGTPWAWAGRHRFIPEVDGDSIGSRFTRFYATLESRRHTGQGRIIVASTLVWADSAVPRPDRSLAARFGNEAGVQLRVFPPGQGPGSRDVFDYSEPTTAGDRPLFSLQPVPPDQGVVEADVRHAAAGTAGWALLVLLLTTLLLARGSPSRLTVLGLLLWCVLRSPLGPGLGFESLFSPLTFFRSALRPLSASAGNLLVTGGVLLVLAIWLWERRPARHPLTTGLAALLLLGAPFLISDLGRGITPPISGVTTPLWIGWQLTLTVATSAIILLAAALLRGREGEGGWGAVALGVLLALVATVIGLDRWTPRAGWPAWYTMLWLPALVLTSRRAPRWAALVGTTIVAGAAAALVTWGADLNGRTVVAQRDLSRLGDVEDPLATPLLERFSEQLRMAPEPTTASMLYLLWRASDLAGQEYPVRLGLWEPSGARHAELSLDSLDLPAPLVATLVRSLDSVTPRRIVPLQRIPGRHYVLLERLPSGLILTAGIGPRTRLLGPTRLARLLRSPAEGAPLYDLSLSPPTGPARVSTDRRSWWRDGNEIRTEWLIDFPGGRRHVHAEVDLRPRVMMLGRGALLVALDLLVVALVWGLTIINLAALRQRLAVRRLARSFQIRLAATLGLFFLLPAAGFTLWGLGRLKAESDRTRDLLISAALRDAVLSAGDLLREPGSYLTEGLGELSNRMDADLLLYSGGRLVATSEPILEDLSLVEPLLDGRAYQRLALGDELELTRPATTYVAPVRVGYRVAQAGPPGGVGILATPQLAYDWARTQDQQDLTYALLLASLAGLAAAALGAQLAARALSRPVADLRRSASAIGRGQAPPAVGTPPVEFEQVFGAFDRMASDIRTSQAALEEARRRTAVVLANVATGVVALDRTGHLTLANPRAEQLVGRALPAGALLAERLSPEWAPLAEAVARFLPATQPERATDLEVSGRAYRLRLARLEHEAGGLVLVLDDLTDATQAARVLAWGEMARQVAHEIKNPLTPIRLGMQHLRRVARERPQTLGATLDETTTRILGEIDRLDTIARAFSRFGLPGAEGAPLEVVDLAATAREVAALYRITSDGVMVAVEEAGAGVVAARKDEVKEVLGNLIENARNAGARRIVLRSGPLRLVVQDDGAGIAPDLLPRIFEPRFSTNTSGSGLGLAIVRRLVEGWGATVVVSSEVGRGATVTLAWPGAAP